MHKSLIEPILHKLVNMVNSYPIIKWTEVELDRMNIIQDLKYAIIGEFSYGWPNPKVLRKAIPLQCVNKGDCKIGLFRSRHVFIRLSLMEYFVNLISKGDYYITCNEGFYFIMRTLIYDVRFKIDEETTKAMA